MNPSESINSKLKDKRFFLFECKGELFFAEDYIYLPLDPRMREGFVFPRSVSWVFIIIHPYAHTHIHTGWRGVVFVFNLYPFVYAKGWKNLFSRLRVAFPEDILFVDQKSLLILRLRQLPKNISSFPIKLRTITSAANSPIKVF